LDQLSTTNLCDSGYLSNTEQEASLKCSYNNSNENTCDLNLINNKHDEFSYSYYQTKQDDLNCDLYGNDLFTINTNTYYDNKEQDNFDFYNIDNFLTF
jgi:hypothetical protein